MINIRARFIRGDEVKYISHLDMMKMFERALRRSRIPICYSQGFNPHPQIVFGLPLSVGVTSEDEYVDLSLCDFMEPGIFTETLNKQLPEGLRIVEAKEKNTKSNIMASITKASYKVLVTIGQNEGIKELHDNVLRFLENKEIYIKKESKGKIKEVNIRPLIHKLDVQSVEENMVSNRRTDDKQECNSIELLEYIKKLNTYTDKLRDESIKEYFCFSLLVNAGSASNLKPEIVVQSFMEASGLNIQILKVHRSGLFIDKGDRSLNPLDDNVLLVI